MKYKSKKRKNYGLSVFLADDDPDDRELFSEAIAEVGGDTELKVFHDGNALMQELRSSAKLPDVIFLDLYMPKMDGATCLAEIRADKKFDSIGIVLYSSLIAMQRIEELFRKGANRYLRKPSTYSSLVMSLARTLESIAKNPTGGMTVINYTD